MPTLGVNIDHVATIRQARRTVEPDPIAAAVLAELAGAEGITVHLREDRRHMQDRDVRLLRETVRTHLNLEMAATDEMVKIALEIKPDYVTLVPERREEVTTEGGLDIAGPIDRMTKVVNQLQSGQYAEAKNEDDRAAQLHLLKLGCEIATSLNLRINAGHGLTYWNVYPVGQLPGMEELNIGHTIISRAVLVGLERAVREMKLAIAGELQRSAL